MTRKHSSRSLLFPAFALLFTFLLRTEVVRQGVQEGMELSYLAVVPSVFPFAVISSYIMGHTDTAREPRILRPLSRLLSLPPGGATCFILGLLCGFPLGAKCVSDGYRSGLFSKQDAERLLMFCNNTGPAFLVGGIGGLFGSPSIGWTLFAIQCFLVFFTAFLTGRRREYGTAQTYISKPVTFVSAVSSGVHATLTVLGFVLFFSSCIAILKVILPAFPLLAVASLLEVSTASRLASTMPYGGIWCSFAVCFSGISVHLQTAAVMDGTDLSLRPYIVTKCILGFAGALLAFAILRH